jgi:hypothetical protein
MRGKTNRGEIYPKNKIACSIQITCTQAAGNGEMSVEMNYEGDTCLAAYLLEDATKVINERIEEEAAYQFEEEELFQRSVQKIM